MVIGLLILVLYVCFVWLVFFKLRLLQFSIAWGIVTVVVGLHLLLIFVIGLRFVTPYSTDAKIIQHTIQLVPRLSEPTLVTAVLVEPNVPVKKGQPLFQFDRRIYEYKVAQLQAQLAQAKQNVGVLKADVQWPVSGLWVIGLFVAIDLIFNGWAYVFIALAARKASQAKQGELRQS